MKRTMGALALVALLLLPSLHASDYSADWKAFSQKIEKDYPFFDLKDIRKDWMKNKRSLEQRAKAAQSDEEFLVVIRDSLSLLRDSHSGIIESKAKLPTPAPQYCFPLTFMPGKGGQVIVITEHKSNTCSDLNPGTVIETINGKNAGKFLDEQATALWEKGGGFSSPQRARMFTYRLPLLSEEISEYKITWREKNQTKTTSLKNDAPMRLWIHNYNMPKNLKKGSGFCSYTQLPSGVGYLYIRRIRGDETIQGIQSALKDYPETKGWIIDLRGNGGGGYNAELPKTLSASSQPLAVIIDEGCISAGETLARDLKQDAKAHLFGTRTAGASTAKDTWSFPSGIATLVLSNRSRFGIDRKPIEFNGIEPDTQVLPAPEEVAKGLNSEIIAAEKYLLSKKK